MADLLKAVEPPVEPVESARFKAIQSNSERKRRAEELVKMLQEDTYGTIVLRSAGNGAIRGVSIVKGTGAAKQYVKEILLDTNVPERDRYRVVAAFDTAVQRLSQAFPDKLDYGTKRLHFSFAEGEIKEGKHEISARLFSERVGDEDAIRQENARQQRRDEEERDDFEAVPRSRGKRRERLEKPAESKGAWENMKNAIGASQYYMDASAGADATAFLPLFKPGKSAEFQKTTVDQLVKTYQYDPNAMDKIVSEYNMQAKRLNEKPRKDAAAAQEYTAVSAKRRRIMEESRDFVSKASALKTVGGELAAAYELARDRGDVLDRRADSASMFPPRSLDRR